MTDADERVTGKARQNLETVRRYEDEHESEASAVQRTIERVSQFCGSPAYFIGVVGFAVLWIGGDAWGRSHGWPHMEPPPYFWLHGMVSLNALLLTIAVLIRQSRMSELAERRAHLDLQINLLTEQKVTKILAVLAERGLVDERSLDEGHQELTKPADPAALLDAIKKVNDD